LSGRSWKRCPRYAAVRMWKLRNGPSGIKRPSSLNRSAFVPGYTDKSRGYLRLAVVNYQRAGDCDNPEMKAKFFEVARQYVDLALQIDDPAAWRAKLLNDAKPKRKHS